MEAMLATAAAAAAAMGIAVVLSFLLTLGHHLWSRQHDQSSLGPGMTGDVAVQGVGGTLWGCSAYCAARAGYAQVQHHHSVLTWCLASFPSFWILLASVSLYFPPSKCPALPELSCSSELPGAAELSLLADWPVLAELPLPGVPAGHVPFVPPCQLACL